MAYLGNIKAKAASIVTADIAAGQITTALIADDGITAAKIADDAVVAAAIADNAVVTAAINADAVTAAKIGADQIGNSELNLGANYAFTGTITGAGGGKVLQVVHMNYTGTSIFSNSYQYHSTPITANITPSATSSKIYIQAVICCSSDGETSWTGRLYRGGSSIAEGASSGNSPGVWIKNSNSNSAWNETTGNTYLDSPSSTSQLTYIVHVGPHDNGRTLRVNYSASNSNQDTGDQSRGMCTLTLWEIAG